MRTDEHLLTIAAEECMETAQRATKALRFGLDEVQPGQELTNADRLVYEFNDLVAVMKMLHERGSIPHVFDETAQANKREKVMEYMGYSESLGLVSGDTE